MSDAALVHIVDDDPGVRAGLSSLVRSVGYAARLYGSAGEFSKASFPLSRLVSCWTSGCQAPTVSICRTPYVNAASTSR